MHLHCELWILISPGLTIVIPGQDILWIVNPPPSLGLTIVIPGQDACALWIVNPPSPQDWQLSYLVRIYYELWILPFPRIDNCHTWSGCTCTENCEFLPPPPPNPPGLTVVKPGQDGHILWIMNCESSPPPGFLKSWASTFDHLLPNVKSLNSMMCIGSRPDPHRRNCVTVTNIFQFMDIFKFLMRT